MQEELERILSAYQKLEERMEQEEGYFSYRDPAHLVRKHERYWGTLRLLHQTGYRRLVNLKILDVGCGDGDMLRQFIQWGARPENLAGIELRQAPVDEALSLNPELDVRCGSATSLPWPDKCFDLVGQHTVFTSILEAEMKRQVAAEMDRVLKPEGAILWYDFIYNNPHNEDVKGIRAKEIRELFPGFEIALRKITLAPPIARRIPVNLLPTLYPLLGTLPFLQTHYLGLFIKE